MSIRVLLADDHAVVRKGIRDFYRSYLPLTSAARADARLNPGNGWVSRLCHDPRIAVALRRQASVLQSSLRRSGGGVRRVDLQLPHADVPLVRLTSGR